MSDYLARYDAAPEDQKYPLVRGWIDNEPFPFFKELREKRPLLVTPVATLVTRLDDLPRVREMVGKICANHLGKASSNVEIVHSFCCMAPATVVRGYFGLTGQKLDSLIDWSYWNQVDMNTACPRFGN